MSRALQRIAIVNRGEPAMRLIHAVREFNREHGASVETIALYTEPDAGAMFVREADEAALLGPATYLDPRDGQRKSQYLDYDLVERALTEARADAVWVGWGFVAEHADFAERCERLGIVFLGPSAEVMRKLGDKITSKRLAEEAEVPVAPWSGGPVASLEEARAHAETLGFPLMVKATSGGGGRGIRRVDSMPELAAAFTGARAESLKAFGDDTVFLERMVQGARHVEVQIMADGQGAVWALGVRDCSVQRKHQKVFEESPSPALTAAQDRALREAAARLCARVGYRSAGTVEFLYDASSETFSFMEVNARLQVEHPVTEVLTGVDLVKLQLHVGQGGRLEGDAPEPRGHAIEARLNAEDPANGFAPGPGDIEVMLLPSGPGVRVDTGVEAGDRVPPDFDSMIAKIIAYGRTRAEALARLERALSEGSVLLRGGATNKALLLDLCAHPDFRAGAVDIGWLDRLLASGSLGSTRGGALALLVAATEAHEAANAEARRAFFATAARGRPELSQERGLRVELAFDGASYAFTVRRMSAERYQVELDEGVVDVTIERFGDQRRGIMVAGQHHRALILDEGPRQLVELDGHPYRITRDEGGVVRAPAPAVVVSIAVAPGDRVEVGDRLVILEAMKMETALCATFSGTVTEVLAQPNMQVPAGDLLLKIAPEGGDDAGQGGARLSFAELITPSATREAACTTSFESLHDMVLGYDVSSKEIEHLSQDHGRICEQVAPDDPTLCAFEEQLLEAFVDRLALFARRGKGDLDGEGRESAREYLTTYLSDLAGRGEGLPAAFLARLERALSHYGVEDLTPTPALRSALYRLYRAQGRSEAQHQVVLSVLERRLRDVDVMRSRAGAGFRELIDRLIKVTRSVYPALHGCAEEVRFRYYDAPVLTAVRNANYAESEARLAMLAADPRGPARQSHIQALVEAPQPLKRFLSSRFRAATPELREAMLEVLARRYYRIRDLEELRPLPGGQIPKLSARYTHEGTRYRLFAAHPLEGPLEGAIDELRPFLAEVPEGEEILVDLYLWSGADIDTDQCRQALERELEGADFGRPVEWAVVAISSPSDADSHKLPAGRRGSGVRHFAFKRDDERGRMVEQPLYRGLHPMMAARLGLDSFAAFKLERLSSAEDIYVFHGVAHDNPRDIRLFAMAEVRGLTPIRDDQGHVIELPLLRSVFTEALAGIRRFQWRQAPRERLRWNRVYLFIRPVVSFSADETTEIIRRLAPETEDLGLEKAVIMMRVPDGEGGTRAVRLDISNPGGTGVITRQRPAVTAPLEPLDAYSQNVVRLKRRGLMYPYEIIRLLTPEREGVATSLPPGRFLEHDLDDTGARLVPVERPYGQNSCNVVVGLITNETAKHPEGMTRVAILSDPSRSMGSLAEPECRRIAAAIDLAEAKSVPLEWYAVSGGAKISMDSGTENMDWISVVLKRLVEFTQAGGEVNLLVLGINVGAQPYWNAEATMLMHTRGVLIQTENAAMVLTGKDALDYSGGVSAEDNLGIGGYERVMGPNGQAQYFARDVHDACHILLRYYEHSYVAPGERFPRSAATADPRERDVRAAPHGGSGAASFSTIGEIFSDAHNPGRKKPFDIREVMAAVIDRDHAPLERWYGARDAEIAVVWDAHLGGHAVSVLGIESQPIARLGYIPADGPRTWTGGTLFPSGSKKIARAINAASGNRPVVILANLSGFDGSPESMRRLQLEYGAEIGRAVVNFDGPLIFCVVQRYHGGAFVVFSNRLNEQLEVVALEGTKASVIGGAPAAAVVFSREVKKRTRQDPRVIALEERVARSSGTELVALRAELRALIASVRSEKLGELAEEFDQIHSVQRAHEVGSVNTIIDPATLRPYLIEAIERGMERTLAKLAAKG